jgi:hypothetical protein
MLFIVEVDKGILFVVFIDLSFELNAIRVEMGIGKVLAEVVDVIFSVDFTMLFVIVICCG